MLKKILNIRLILILTHILIGYISTFSFFPKLYGLAVIIIPVAFLIYTKNKNDEALIFAGYLVGAEVFLRMTSGVILYETGKYGVAIFLFLGFYLGEYRNKKFGLQFIFYLFFLLLGIVFTRVPEGESIRKAIAFNLSGPIILGIAAIYFYSRSVKRKNLLKALFTALLPIFSMATFLYFKAPDIREIIFRGVANFEASGGFGPNQVATAFGFGIFILVTFLILKERISGYLVLDLLFLLYFVYRALLTFSRGGLVVGIIAILIFAVFFILSSRNSLKLVFKYIIVALFFGLSVWIYTSDATGGMLDNRYTGKNARGVQKEDVSSGRVAIFQRQIKSFVENPVGIGVGNGKYKRVYEDEQVTAASHNEIGRLLEEHGVFGLITLIILIVVPLFNFWNSNNYQRGFIIAFYFIWFLTINHSAMRIALPGFIYALSLITITDDEKEPSE